MDTLELQKFVIEHKLEQRTKDSFCEYLKNYALDCPQEFNAVFKEIKIEKITTELSKVSLSVIYSFDNLLNLISVYLTIFYDDDDIGMYEVVFTLQGEHRDEFLEINN